MKLADWKAQSQKRLEKRLQAQASQPKHSPNLSRYLANFRAAIADRNYEYGTVRRWASDQKICPDYDQYARAINRDYVFTADGWKSV
jgi:hypothetical protein